MWRRMGNSKSHYNVSIYSAPTRGVSPADDSSRSLSKHKLADSAHRPSQLAKSKRSTGARTLFSSSISDHINKSIQPVATSHLIPTPLGYFNSQPGPNRITLKKAKTNVSKPISYPTSDSTDSSHPQKLVPSLPSLPTAPTASQTTCCHSDTNSSVPHPRVLQSKQGTQSAPSSSSTNVRDCQVVPCASNPPSRMSDSQSSPQQPLFKYELDGGVFDINEALHYSPAELHRFKNLVGMLDYSRRC